MKNIIIGTAGHVDHGKTALIKALTGIETDRIKEEKKRGITIELGFAYLDLPDGEKAGIIDVPGHEKFVKNMLAGAGGIDLALLVVAADEGFMPQTREHLGILSLLDIPEGLIVVTKKDMVEEDWLEVIKEDIRAEVKNTFLENAPILAVSSFTGDGIDELKQAIFSLINKNVQLKNLDIPWRVPVDRVFSIEGFGTVITGTLIEGKVSVGEPVLVYPAGLETKIRNLQVHSKDVNTAFAGQRVAINLAGLKKSDINKGDVIAQPSSMHTTMMLDIKLIILKDCQREILNATRLHLYHGAKDILCKIILLDRESVSAGETCFAQLRLEEEIALKTRDRFVLRFYSPLETIGGGVVLDSNPLKHKRGLPEIVEALKIKDTGSDKEKISEALKEYSPRLENINFLQIQTAIPKEEFNQQLQKLLKEKTAFKINDNLIIHINYLNYLRDAAIKLLGDYHAANPLRDGMPKNEFRGKLLHCDEIPVIDKITDSLVNRKAIKYVGTGASSSVALFDFQIQLNSNQQVLIDKLEQIFLDGAFAPPSTDQIEENFSKEKNLKQVLDSMIRSGVLVRVDDKIILHSKFYNQAFQKAVDYISQNKQITLPELRDLLGTSRKYAVAILEYWDRKNITKKIGDARVLAQTSQHLCNN